MNINKNLSKKLVTVGLSASVTISMAGLLIGVNTSLANNMVGRNRLSITAMDKVNFIVSDKRENVSAKIEADSYKSLRYVKDRLDKNMDKINTGTCYIKEYILSSNRPFDSSRADEYITDKVNYNAKELSDYVQSMDRKSNLCIVTSPKYVMYLSTKYGVKHVSGKSPECVVGISKKQVYHFFHDMDIADLLSDEVYGVSKDKQTGMITYSSLKSNSLLTSRGSKYVHGAKDISAMYKVRYLGNLYNGSSVSIAYKKNKKFYLYYFEKVYDWGTGSITNSNKAVSSDTGVSRDTEIDSNTTASPSPEQTPKIEIESDLGKMSTKFSKFTTQRCTAQYLQYNTKDMDLKNTNLLEVYEDLLDSNKNSVLYSSAEVMWDKKSNVIMVTSYDRTLGDSVMSYAFDGKTRMQAENNGKYEVATDTNVISFKPYDITAVLDELFSNSYKAVPYKSGVAYYAKRKAVDDDLIGIQSAAIRSRVSDTTTYLIYENKEPVKLLRFTTYKRKNSKDTYLSITAIDLEFNKDSGLKMPKKGSTFYAG